MTKFSSLLILLAFLAACRQYSGPEPLEFKAYGNNPILGPGEPGEWDDLGTLSPSALIHEDTFYLFYTGMQKNGRFSIGLATSEDGYHFEKYEKNPLLVPRENGFDSYLVCGAVIIREDSVWVLYYNASETALFSPGPFIGMATSKELTGPWERTDAPVLARGHRSEWDGRYIFPNSILKMEDGSYRLYYTAGVSYPGIEGFIGMAISRDGIRWAKYNDPATTEHPYADSDPVFIADNRRDKAGQNAWSAWVNKTLAGYEMYYSVIFWEDNVEIAEIEHAFSKDGIHFEKSQNKPVYRRKDDPLGVFNTLEFPTLVRLDSVWFMYFDYGIGFGSIGLAIGTN
jgi:predicted GH43/DUF377 family glycosyl hydrolase